MASYDRQEAGNEGMPCCSPLIHEARLVDDVWVWQHMACPTKNRKGSLKDHWKQFISKHTYKNLTQSICRFIGLVCYVQLNILDVVIVPHTTNEVDVENYLVIYLCIY